MRDGRYDLLPLDGNRGLTGWTPLRVLVVLLFMATVFVAYGYVWRRGGLSWD